MKNNIGKRLINGVSLLPILWVCLLYFLTLIVWMKLGHFPRPSLDDPKYMGVSCMHFATVLGMFIAIYAVIAWVILLPFTLWFKLITKKYVLLMLVGVVLMFFQLIIDPFKLVMWLLD